MSKKSYNSSHGYILFYQPEHPASDYKGNVYEHRLVMEEHLGRYVAGTEHIHHINGDTKDNRIENLHVCSPSEHHRLHNGWRKENGIWLKQCPRCKEWLEVTKENWYFRKIGAGANSPTARCKECELVEGRRWKRQNSDKVRKYNKLYWQKLQKKRRQK